MKYFQIRPAQTNTKAIRRGIPKNTHSIQKAISFLLEAGFNKRQELCWRNGQVIGLPIKGDLIFVRREPLMNYYDPGNKRREVKEK